ncbi:unnamed protein product [Auanema sp. JU1783]|nr:unnamed protein product [Auanema sp. JU1783]
MLVFIALFVLSSIEASSRFADDSHLMTRNRRQAYYLCGVHPNKYYSTDPCPTSDMCTNGGRYLNVGCTSSAQCTPYYSGTSTCINSCCCTVPSNPTPPPNNLNRFGYCPSGQLSEVRCSGRNQCPSGHVCMTGLCCAATSNDFQEACGNQMALGVCTGGSCNVGICTASNYCCECSVGRSGGRAQNGFCAAGYSSNSIGYCCPTCPGNTMPFGTCRNGVCGGGRTCRAGNICC